MTVPKRIPYSSNHAIKGQRGHTRQARHAKKVTRAERDIQDKGTSKKYKTENGNNYLKHINNGAKTNKRNTADNQVQQQ